MLSRMDIVQLLLDHGGVARRRTLMQAGATQWAIRQAVAFGKVKRVGTGMYGIAGTFNLEDLDIAVATTGGVVSHDTAAVLLGLDVTHVADSHITVARGRKVSHPGFHIHHSDVSEVCRAGGLPVTSVLRTVVDCARTLPLGDALIITESALRRKLVTHHELRQAVRTLRGVGAPAAKRVVRYCDPLSGSLPESMLRARIIVAGLPVPKTQVNFTDRDGVFLFRADFAWPDQRLVVEVDGYEFHSSKERFRRDRRIGNELLLGRWRLLRFTWEDIAQSPDYTLDFVRRLLQT